MIRQPPRSIRLHPRVPYTWLFRSILFVRWLSALVILAPLVWRAGPRTVFVVAQPGRHLLRALLIVAEVSCFYLAVRHLPLADVMAVYQATPLIVTVLAIPLLGERVDRKSTRLNSRH